jgi:hypothetical protein
MLITKLIEMHHSTAQHCKLPTEALIVPEGHEGWHSHVHSHTSLEVAMNSLEFSGGFRSFL